MASLADDDVFEPNLPGWRPRPAKPATFFKPQTLKYANGGTNVESLRSQREREARAQEKAEEVRRERAKEAAAAAVATAAAAAASKPASSSSSSFPAPRYVANAGVVLRYRGWYSEPVPAGSSRLEAKVGFRGAAGAAGAAGPPRSSSSSPSAQALPPPSSSPSASSSAAKGIRIRQIELRLYLEDATADVVEPKVPNSGLEQGLIVRRHLLTKGAAKGMGKKEKSSDDDFNDPLAAKAKNEDETPLGPEDIRVGDVVHVFGRSITVADADAATRAWLRAAAEADKKSSSNSASPAASPFEGLPGEAIPVPEGDYEIAMRSAAAARELGKARRCAEVSEGSGSGARLWDRLPVPAGGWKATPKAPGEEESRSIMARLFDGGADRAGASSSAAHTKSRPPLPPHNGFGSEEDSASSCHGLIPRARVRRAPSAADAGIEARFAARLAGPDVVPGACRLGEGDSERRFSVRWTPEDGAVSVFEERAPGYPGGKFLERKPVRRPACACSSNNGKGGFSLAAPGILACGACGGSGGSGSGSSTSSANSNSLPPAPPPPPPPPSYYSEPDFYVGAPLRLHGRGFVLTAADEAALRRMEASRHPLASKERAISEARAALERAAGGASAEAGSAEVAFGASGAFGADLLREALAAVALQKQERGEEKSSSSSSSSSSKEGSSETRGNSSPSPSSSSSSSPSSSLLLLSPEELGEAFAAAGAQLRGPAHLQVTLARALGGSERLGNQVDAAEVLERLFG